MSQNLALKDKIIIDTTDSAEVKEMFSRLAPGDECSGKFTASLDEAGEQIITLSIKSLQMNEPTDDEATAEPEPDEDEEKEKAGSAAISVMKNEDGVPDNDGNVALESSTQG